MIYKNNKNNKGFTILETLVAITIILIAITGPLDIIAHSLKVSYYSRDEVTAFYLAQEAIEYARNQRDNNELNPGTAVDDWLVGVFPNECLNDAGVPANHKCVLLQQSDGTYTYQACDGTTCVTDDRKYAMKKSDTGVYGSAGGVNLEDTNFTREIYFTKVVDSSVAGSDSAGQTRNEVVETVNVYWTNSFGSDNKFTLSTHLFNWKITE